MFYTEHMFDKKENEIMSRKELEKEIMVLIKELPYQNLQMIISLSKGFLNNTNKFQSNVLLTNKPETPIKPA